jgi:hypothetical protein
MRGKNLIIALIIAVIVSGLCTIAYPFAHMAMIILDHNDACAAVCFGAIALAALALASKGMR